VKQEKSKNEHTDEQRDSRLIGLFCGQFCHDEPFELKNGLEVFYMNNCDTRSR
jgi:hypothetical protein